MHAHRKQAEKFSCWTLRLVALPMVHPSQIESRLRAILQPKRRQTIPTRKTVAVAALATVAFIAPLAALRPVAQARPVRPAEVNALPSPLTGGQSPPDGVGMRLAGVTEIGNTSALTKPWWGPSGDVLPRPLFRKTNATFSSAGHSDHYRALAFKSASPDGKPVTVEFRPSLSHSYSSAGSWPGKMGDTSPTTEAQIDAATGGYRVLYAAYPVGATQDDIRVGVGAGPWKTAASDVNFAHGSIRAFSVGAYAFSPLTKTAGGSVVTISVSMDEDPQHPSSDLRVVAVDRAGHERLPVDIGDNSAGMLDQINARFALPPSAITSVRLETRPFHWLTFRNVPLRPRS